VIFAVTAVLSNLPFLLAELSPPPGRVFVGTFAYTVDYLDYLAHAQQAEDGHFFLGSKYYPHPHAANYVNLEWWLVGTLSRLLGRHPVLAYRLVGLAALFLFVVVLDRWLRRAGLPARHRAAALTLVLSGAGLGGLRFLVGHTPLYLCMDLLAGLFPVIEILYNPHFVIGTALLLVCLDLFASAKSLRGVLLAVLMGTVVGLMRPYELVILTATHLLVAAAHDPPRLWPRRIAPVVGLVPVLLFNLVTLVRNPAFAFHQSPHYGMPPASRFVLALLPASLLSLVALGLPRADEQTRHARMVLAGWAVLGLLMIVAPPFFFTAQVLVGVGLPCLVLAALGLARWRPGVTWAVAAVMGTTGLVALYGMVARPETAFVPRERWQIAQAAREPCRQGGILLSPADIGRYVGALTACQPVISHPYLLDAHEVSTEVEALFNTAAPTAWRTFIERWDVTHLALPNAVATRAEQALGPSSAFRRLAALGSGDDEVVLFGPARDGAHERRP
jgi:hypothetical protein